ncbi:MAG TPA: flippase [Polyangia bacterium]|jgi:O-antigen/teichoic acid export membrane protein|nr:flippase [Polyangia bacterium]
MTASLGQLGKEGRTALGNAAVKALSVPVEKACRLGLMVVAAPILGAAAFGSYQFAFAATTMMALCTDLGMSVWTTRALARDRSRAPVIVATALRLRLFATLPYLGVVAVAALLAGPGDTRRALALLGLAALVNAFVDYLLAIFRGFERLVDEARLNVARAVLISAGGLAALALRRSVGSLSAGLLVGMVASGLYGLGVLRRGYGLDVRAGKFDRDLWRAAAGEALPLWFATLFSLLYFKGDVVILKAFSSNAEVGAYSAAYKIFEGSMIVPAVVLAATFPPLARAKGDPERQRRWEAALVMLLLALGAAVAVVVYAASGPIVALVYGAGFVRAVPSLRVLAAALPILFLNYGLTHFLIARDLERRNLQFAALMLLVNVGANLLVVPRLGGPGAAWATLVTEVALTICCVVALRLRSD